MRISPGVCWFNSGAGPGVMLSTFNLFSSFYLATRMIDDESEKATPSSHTEMHQIMTKAPGPEYAAAHIPSMQQHISWGVMSWAKTKD